MAAGDHSRASANAGCRLPAVVLGQEMPQVVGHVPGRRVPLRGPLRQRLQADAFQFLGNGVVDLPRRPGLDAADLLQQFLPAESPRNGRRPVSNS